MRILFLCSSHNSLSQRAHVELAARGHEIAVELALSPEIMIEAVELFRPQLILAPFLKQVVPRQIWAHLRTLIVHPGIIGDRGPSSLDWAILEQEPTWGVTVLEAVEEMDAGPIWASRTFPMRDGTKSSLYKNEVVDAAAEAILEAVERVAGGKFKPTPLDYTNPAVRGRLRPPCRQADRAFAWTDPSEQILRKIRSADGNPGALTTLCGQELFVYGAHLDDFAQGVPGTVVAQRDGGVCVATGDGALWVSHARRRGPDQLRLAATTVLRDHLATVPTQPVDVMHAPPGRTWREIWYEERAGVGHLHFDFYNGAMSTEQCHRLQAAIGQARKRPTKVLVLWGGQDYFSNGIHLYTIEAAKDPGWESWENIQAINDVCREIITITDRVVISAMQGNAGAGGVMMALGADRVWARRGVVLNPHYKGMGGLFGSEYWTWALPRRVGRDKAKELTESLLPLGSAEAVRIGLLDDAFGETVRAFRRDVIARAEDLAASADLIEILKTKNHHLTRQEAMKPLAEFRREELREMLRCFLGEDPAYHHARTRFVRKSPVESTPRHLATHRRRRR